MSDVRPRAHTVRVTSPLFDLRVRLSFPDRTRPLDETAAIMSEWARAVAPVLAPELRWDARLVESGPLGGGARWGHRHVLALSGASGGVERGRGEVRLVAGGDAARLGGNGLLELETVSPVRYLLVDNHCNVTHWDLAVAPIDELAFDRARRALEDALGARARLGGERKEPLVRAPQIVATASADEAALWIEDLASVGIACRGQTTPDGVTVIAERADLDDVAALAEARVVLGEVLGEAGHEDWLERARELLVRLP